MSGHDMEGDSRPFEVAEAVATLMLNRPAQLGFTGNHLHAATANAWGLALDVLEPDALLPYCRQCAHDMLGCDPDALRDLRTEIRQGVQTTLDQEIVRQNEPARKGLDRLSQDGFAVLREAPMQRGKRQAGRAMATIRRMRRYRGMPASPQ